MTRGWFKYAAVFMALGLAVAAVYQAGYGKARAEGCAALEALKRQYSDEAAAQWAAYAANLQEAGLEAQQAQARADALEADLLKAKTALAVERRGFAKRIADATRDSDCPLSPDVVRLYNEALYGSAPAPAAGSEGSAAGAAGPAHGAGPPAPPGAGILRQQPVTMKDLLAHARLYGEWARGIYALALGWKALSADW